MSYEDPDIDEPYATDNDNDNTVRTQVLDGLGCL